MRPALNTVIICACCVIGLLAAASGLNAPTEAASMPWSSDFSSLPLHQPGSELSKLTPPIKPRDSWEGIAGWYGEEFDGRLTANGEIFDMYAPTAAHLTLPLGSLVRVVYPKTGRSMIVRINDRGPYVEGRELDVSYGVARSLGFDQKGIARVRIELLELPRKHCQPRRTND